MSTWVSTNEIMGAEASVDDRNQRTYTRRFRVIYDDTLASAQEAREASGIPSMLTPWEGPDGNARDDESLLISKSATQDDNPKVWMVECRYTSVTRLKQVRISWQQDQRPLIRDANGRPILTSAKRRFDPPLMKDFSRAIIQISRWEPSYQFFKFLSYADTVNEDEWLGFPPGTCKIAAPPADSTFEIGNYGWMVHYEIHFRAEGWNEPVMDADYYRLDDDGDEQVIFDKFGNLSASPTLLNGRGGLLRDTFSFLDDAIDEATEEIVLLDDPSTLFPDAPFQVLLGSDLTGEVMTVNEVLSGNRLKVTRGVNGTTAQGWSGGEKVAMEPYFFSFQTHQTMLFADLNLP